MRRDGHCDGWVDGDVDVGFGIDVGVDVGVAVDALSEDRGCAGARESVVFCAGWASERRGRERPPSMDGPLGVRP